MCINMDFTAMPFYKKQNLLDFLKEHVPDLGRGLLKPEDCAKCVRLIKGIQVQQCYPRAEGTVAVRNRKVRIAVEA